MGGAIGAFARKSGRLAAPWFIDYFAFSRGLYESIPPFVIGRIHWDHWLIWKARSSGAAVIDASPSVLAVHQNHDYSYHPKGKQECGATNNQLATVNLWGGDCATARSSARPTSSRRMGCDRNWKGPFAVYWASGVISDLRVDQTSRHYSAHPESIGSQTQAESRFNNGAQTRLVPMSVLPALPS